MKKKQEKKKQKKNVHHQVRSGVRRRVKRKRNHYSVKDRCKWLQKDDSKEKYHTRIYIYTTARHPLVAAQLRCAATSMRHTVTS